MPNCFGTPESEKETSPLTERVVSSSLTKGANSRPKALPMPSFLRRRPGQSVFAARPEETRSFQVAAGFNKKNQQVRKSTEQRSQPL